MNKTEEIVHAYNICALVLAILYPRPLSAEEAFTKMDNPDKDLKTRTEDAEMLRAAGCSWKEISELLGMANPQSAILQARRYQKLKTKNQNRHQQKTTPVTDFSLPSNNLKNNS